MTANTQTTTTTVVSMCDIKLRQTLPATKSYQCNQVCIQKIHVPLSFKDKIIMFSMFNCIESSKLISVSGNFTCIHITVCICVVGSVRMTMQETVMIIVWLVKLVIEIKNICNYILDYAMAYYVKSVRNIFREMI